MEVFKKEFDDIKLISQGKRAAIFRAIHRKSKKIMALKIISKKDDLAHEHEDESGKVKTLFDLEPESIKELTFLKQLRNPNIIK